jgi:hypothetical protein
LALQESCVQFKVTHSKLAEWQQETHSLLNQPWKSPPLYRAICEAYTIDPNYNNPSWVQSNQLVFRQGLYYKDNRVAIPDNLGLKIDVLVEHHDSLMGGHLRH